MINYQSYGQFSSFRTKVKEISLVSLYQDFWDIQEKNPFISMRKNTIKQTSQEPRKQQKHIKYKSNKVSFLKQDASIYQLHLIKKYNILKSKIEEKNQQRSYFTQKERNYQQQIINQVKQRKQMKIKANTQRNQLQTKKIQIDSIWQKNLQNPIKIKMSTKTLKKDFIKFFKKPKQQTIKTQKRENKFKKFNQIDCRPRLKHSSTHRILKGSHFKNKKIVQSLRQSRIQSQNNEFSDRQIQKQINQLKTYNYQYPIISMQSQKLGTVYGSNSQTRRNN